MVDIANISWYMKYAPKILDDYIFESDELEQNVRAWCAAGKIPGNILLYGSAGVGKTVLCEILIRSIIKSQHDLNRIRSRSVAEIDELSPWLEKAPVKSKSKIVYFEEIDKISRQSQTTLKDGLLEKYQKFTSFIATTNFITRIDPALTSRFNYQIEIKGENVAAIQSRLSTILKEEKVEFDEVSLKTFVNGSYKMGMRNLITTMQAHCNNGVVDLGSIKTGIDSFEEKIATQTVAIFQKIMSSHDPMQRKLALLQPMNNSIVAKEYAELIEILQFTRNLNWDNIFIMLVEKIKFVPIQSIASKYLESVEHKKIPHLHYMAFIYEAEKALIDIF